MRYFLSIVKAFRWIVTEAHNRNSHFVKTRAFSSKRNDEVGGNAHAVFNRVFTPNIWRGKNGKDGDWRRWIYAPFVIIFVVEREKQHTLVRSRLDVSPVKLRSSTEART